MSASVLLQGGPCIEGFLELLCSLLATWSCLFRKCFEQKQNAASSNRPSCTCSLQEDAHAVSLDVDGSTKTGFFGVFDGHGGKEVALFTAFHMVSGSVKAITVGKL